jgi:hypothetical protein
VIRRPAFPVLGAVVLLSGCVTGLLRTQQSVTSVAPSSTGIPNSVTAFGDFEFVSVQSTGQIFTYNISTGVQVAAVAPYATPCSDPSGMAVTSIGGSNIMAVVCYDTGSLLTLTVHPDGSLTPLGSVGGLASPYPGMVLDGTNLYIPLFGKVGTANGGVARVSIASPANPVITATTSLASPSTGAFVNPGYLVVSGGYIYETAGSENAPLAASSTVQVINETSMTLVGTPLAVAHSPQQLAVQGSVIYVTFYDAAQLESIDISTPSSIKPLQMLSLNTASNGCNAEPVAVSGATAYIGCNGQGLVEEVNIANPANMQLYSSTIPGVLNPQRLVFAGQYLLATDGVSGGKVYLIYPGTP